jgi:DNA-binding NarL/FixJ family response regulator
MSFKKKVLIIDNEHKFSNRLQLLIRQNSYDAIAVHNKIQALKMLRCKNIDMVVLGTITPKSDMLYVYHWFKHNPDYKNVPLMIVNGPIEPQLSFEWDKQEDTGLTLIDCFFKPIEPDRVMPFIERHMNSAPRKIKVLIVDDQELVREGIRIVLDLHKDIEVVGEAKHGEDAIEKAIKLMPDVVLMDILMPGMNGIEATKHIVEICREARVLILSQYDTNESIQASKAAGACGFISKSSSTSCLISSVRSANIRQDIM